MKQILLKTVCISTILITATSISGAAQTNVTPSADISASEPAIPEYRAEKHKETGLNWKNKKILHIGDSLLLNWGLKGTLRRKFSAAGAKYMVSARKGSNSHSWLVTGLLKRTLNEKKPDIVIINLGSNAVKYRHPENYIQWIQKLVKKIQPRECYWISPPGLIKDNYGFVDMLKDASIPCNFFDSRQANFKRKNKKTFHLSRKQSQKWADMIWQWMNNINNNPTTPETGHGL
jgi:lysophospholipase L1-like esterase